MLKKFLSIVCVAALSTAFVGCEPGDTDLDTTPDVVETPDVDAVTPADDAAVDATEPVEPATN